jgi:beta-1,2-mannosidase
MNPWALGPFRRVPGSILGPSPELTFSCPISRHLVAWAAKDVFNPAAVVRDGQVCLLVRAEDDEGRYAGTSRLGLATSGDGREFLLEAEPVIFPADDQWQAWEWPGGCEDARLVEKPDGGYLCLYTAFDGSRSCLFSASSDDLQRWEKHGPAFAGTPTATRWSKSGSIVTEVCDGRLKAARIDGRFWMYWGEGTVWVATSEDLVRWAPLDYDTDPDRFLSYLPAGGGTAGTGADGGPGGSWSVQPVPGRRASRPVLFPRSGRFDSMLVEPGPPALRGPDGIVLVYNGANHPRRGDPELAAFAYRPAQVLLDPGDPASVLDRPTRPFLDIEEEAERRGQVGDVLFAEGLVLFKDQFLLYLGLADSRIGLAEAPAPEWARS